MISISFTNHGPSTLKDVEFFFPHKALTKWKAYNYLSSCFISCKFISTEKEIDSYQDFLANAIQMPKKFKGIYIRFMDESKSRWGKIDKNIIVYKTSDAHDNHLMVPIKFSNEDGLYISYDEYTILEDVQQCKFDMLSGFVLEKLMSEEIIEFVFV